MISKKWVDFLNANKLSADEFVFLFLVHKNNEDDEINEKFVTYITNNREKVDFLSLAKRLEERDLLINYNKINEFLMERLRVSDNFISILFMDLEQALTDVKKVYPSTLELVPLKGGTTRMFPSFSNPTYDGNLYYNFIEGRRDKHLEFLYVTEEFIKLNDGRAVYKFENYLSNYDGIRLMVEEQAGKHRDTADYDILGYED